MPETATSQALTYKIDPNHSSVRFWARHMMIAKVHGELGDVTGNITYNPQSPEQTQVAATINIASLSSGNEQRDGHLKSPDFLDVEKFPTIEFRSTRVTKKGPNEFEIGGNLTVHGVTHGVILQAEVSDEVTSTFGGYKIGVSASGAINREQFGMVWNQALETGGVLVGKEINIQIDVELDRE